MGQPLSDGSDRPLCTTVSSAMITVGYMYLMLTWTPAERLQRRTERSKMPSVKSMMSSFGYDLCFLSFPDGPIYLKFASSFKTVVDGLLRCDRRFMAHVYYRFFRTGQVPSDDFYSKFVQRCKARSNKFRARVQTRKKTEADNQTRKEPEAHNQTRNQRKKQNKRNKAKQKKS